MDTSGERQEISAAKTAAFRLLKIRPRSIAEIREKLTARAIPAEIIEATIGFLIEKKFLDDRAFARGWIRYRLERPYGVRRISYELQQKGIDPDIIAGELGSLPDDYSEAEVVMALARRRAQRLKGIDPFKRKKRVFDYLSRRGFRLEVIKKAVTAI